MSADAASELELLQRIARALRRYELVAEKTEVDELRDALHAWLRQTVGWLLIVDNADDAQALGGSLVSCPLDTCSLDAFSFDACSLAALMLGSSLDAC